MVNEATKGYVAGIIDGEGSVCIQHRPKRNYDVLVVEVGNTDLEMITFLQTVYGGSITTYQPKQDRIVKSNKLMFSWRVYSKQAEIVLQDILPYLIIKKKQALVGLRLRSFIKPYRQPGRITNEMKLGRLSCYNDIRKLNSPRTFLKVNLNSE